MDQPGRVCRRQAVACRLERGDDLAPLAAVGDQPLRERQTLHQLHRDEHAVIDAADVEHGHDVGVRQLRHRLRLAQQRVVNRQPIGGSGAVVAKHLERDLAVQLRIVCRVHDAHASGTDPIEHDIATEPRAERQLGLARARFHR